MARMAGGKDTGIVEQPAGSGRWCVRIYHAGRRYKRRAASKSHARQMREEIRVAIRRGEWPPKAKPKVLLFDELLADYREAKAREHKSVMASEVGYRARLSASAVAVLTKSQRPTLTNGGASWRSASRRQPSTCICACCARFCATACAAGGSKPARSRRLIRSRRTTSSCATQPTTKSGACWRRQRLRARVVNRSEADGHVFSAENGGLMFNLGRDWYAALERAGISDLRFHDLRNTFASRLVMSGVDLSRVQTLMGHKTPAMTLRYAYLSPQHLRAAVAMLVRAGVEAVGGASGEREYGSLSGAVGQSSANSEHLRSSPNRKKASIYGKNELLPGLPAISHIRSVAGSTPAAATNSSTTPGTSSGLPGNPRGAHAEAICNPLSTHPTFVSCCTCRRLARCRFDAANRHRRGSLREAPG
jgi:hypothetical protein